MSDVIYHDNENVTNGMVASLDDENLTRLEDTASSSIFELSLDASSDIAGLTDAVQRLSHTQVEDVRVDIYNSFTSRWQEQGVATLFEVLGQVPQLLKLEFYGLRIFPYIMPISMAERTLSRAQKLQEFSLVGVNLTATTSMEEEFAEFSNSLKRHPSLKMFSLDNCRLRDDQQNGGPSLDEAIVEPLMEIPTLEKVIIRAMEVTMWGTLSCSSASKLCSSRTLKRLELFVFSKCGSAFLTEMAKSLMKHRRHSKLEDLSVSGCLGGRGGGAARAIAQMIECNTKLKSLELHLRSRTEEDDEAGIIHLSKALIKNRSLTKFQLHGATSKSGSKEAREAYLQMLQGNYSLTDCIQVFHPGFLRPENELYLKLNQVGRGKLLENTNSKRKDWINTLVKVLDDIDCLYYLLHMNPLLCCLKDDAKIPASTPCYLDLKHLEASKRKRRRLEEDVVVMEERVVTP